MATPFHAPEGNVNPLEYEDQLASLVDELSGRMLLGEELPVQQLCKDFPRFAEDLVELWPAMQMTACLAGAATPKSTGLDEALTSVALSLPYQFGDYVLMEELDRGGMGIVFRARQISLNRVVAVKLLLRGQFALPHERKRFRREAQSAAKLDHAAIVPVYDVGEHEGQMFFSMKLVEGSTLEKRLQRGPLPPRRAAKMLATLARAVDYAHSQGVLHRDLKPANVLIDDDGEPHITDFGLALPLGESRQMTRTGAVVGTPAYMAPEQIGRQAATKNTPASDVYSLGAIFYHMLTGDKPFVAATAVDTVMMVLEQEPKPPRIVNRRIPRDLEMIALRCLQKPVELRYESANALADDLESFLRDEPIAARSGHFSHVVARLFRETHHAPILENWGLIWMWHSLVLLCVSLLTNLLAARQIMTSRWSFFLLWAAGISAWGIVYWVIRRRDGPVSFVERQIAHAWAAGLVMILLIIPLEAIMGLRPLQLSPLIAGCIGMVFVVKAGTLSGTFYIQAIVMFVTAIAMAYWPHYAHTLFGLTSAACFFCPGLKYYRQKKQRQRDEASMHGEEIDAAIA